MRIIKGDKDINFGSIYENVVAQELVAHGLEPYYYNSKKRGELDFVIEHGAGFFPSRLSPGRIILTIVPSPTLWIAMSMISRKHWC